MDGQGRNGSLVRTSGPGNGQQSPIEAVWQTPTGEDLTRPGVHRVPGGPKHGSPKQCAEIVCFETPAGKLLGEAPGTSPGSGKQNELANH